MRRFVALLALGCAATSSAQPVLPDAVLRQLKDATVFVRVTLATPTGALARTNGSGFLIHRSGTTGLIVTCAHVVMPGGMPSGPVTVVFDSGTPTETAVAADLVGTDDANDLAILKVEHRRLPRPLDLATASDLRETMPVFIAGYPFGKALALDSGNPSVTISTGTISSFRQTKDGELIQFTGQVDPGNSGGPIVDERGALVGVAVFKVAGAQLGMAVPRETVQATLVGQVQNVVFDRLAVEEGEVRYRVTVHVLDPLGKLKSATLLTIPTEAAPTGRGEAGRPADGRIARKMTEHPLQLGVGRATGEVTLPVDGTEPVKYYYQVRYTTAGGKPRYTPANEYTVRTTDTPPPRARRRGRETPPETAAASQPAPPPEPPGDDWLGDPEQRRQRAAVAAGEPLEIGVSVRGETRTVVDASVTTVQLEGGGVLPCAVWADDGAACLVLHDNGTLRRIAVPELVEERRFLIGQPCTAMDMSAEGLVVGVAGLQELWVFDPTTLHVRSRVPLAGVQKVCSAPTLSIALAGAERDELAVVDLRRREVVRVLQARQFSQYRDAPPRAHPSSHWPNEFMVPAVSPDGRFLFFMSGAALHRFRIEDDNLVYDERGPKLASVNRLEISPDARYVALRSSYNEHHAGHPELGNNGVYVYKTTDLQLPVTSMSTPGTWLALGFDKAAAAIYTAETDGHLSTYNPRGIVEKRYPIDTANTPPRQVLVHPQGRRLLFLTAKPAYWIELPQ